MLGAPLFSWNLQREVTGALVYPLAPREENFWTRVCIPAGWMIQAFLTRRGSGVWWRGQDLRPQRLSLNLTLLDSLCSPWQITEPLWARVLICMKGPSLCHPREDCGMWVVMMLSGAACEPAGMWAIWFSGPTCIPGHSPYPQHSQFKPPRIGTTPKYKTQSLHLSFSLKREYNWVLIQIWIAQHHTAPHAEPVGSQGAVGHSPWALKGCL